MTLGITVLSAKCHYAECRYAECRVFCCFAKCHYAECRYAECSGALHCSNAIKLLFTDKEAK